MIRRYLLIDKLKESIASVLPIVLIVFFTSLFIIPIDNGLILAFLIGSVLLIIGMAIFSLGSEMSMNQIGNHIGSKLTKTKKIALIVIVSFVLGFAITVAEPDLNVLANSVPSIVTKVLVIFVSLGVGLFLTIAMLRIIFGIPIRYLLIFFYAILFIISIFVDKDFIAVAFDSGGVTTGPMTVPFIMALGVGVSTIRSDKNAKQDSFGLVGLCSVGPIIAIMILSFIYSSDLNETSILIGTFNNSVEIGYGYLYSFPTYMLEVALALLPIFAFFMIFQIVMLRINNNQLIKILLGILYTYVGLVLFLTGANVGFSSLGYVIGNYIAVNSKMLLIPFGVLLGWFIIKAEPAVHTLKHQVEDLSQGAISSKTMEISLSIAISLANGLAMYRVISGVNIMYFIVPGYVISLLLSLIVPETFTAIAFDSGGVASGPMTATFMLPLAIGACVGLNGNVMQDAFGLIAFVAMTPLISVQIMGLLAMLKSRKETKTTIAKEFDNNDLIELWEI